MAFDDLLWQALEHRAHIVGVTVNETTIETKIAIAKVTENSLNNRRQCHPLIKWE